MLCRDVVFSAQPFARPSRPAAAVRCDVIRAGPVEGRPEPWPDPAPVMRAFAAAAVVGTGVWLLLAWVADKLLF